jgi:hypothetical protein
VSSDPDSHDFDHQHSLAAYAKQTWFAYGDGITVADVYPGIFKSIMNAKGLPASALDPNKTFKLIYTWVLVDSDAIPSYLDLPYRRHHRQHRYIADADEHPCSKT